MTKQNSQIGGSFLGARAWFPQARFGMFIHFGLYALHGGNENDLYYGVISKKKYEGLMHRFNPRSFNADDWVKLAKDAGARYLVITSKHTEGFCLWDSRFTEYKITRTPFKRDLLKELAEACHRRKMRFGIYYNLSNCHY
ncbi:MAG: alpha-L-fucosidase, partial [Anaerolineales bacterium]|nr:alpha-L-fucosidase [Anaerolineales bacterium]